MRRDTGPDGRGNEAKRGCLDFFSLVVAFLAGTELADGDDVGFDSGEWSSSGVVVDAVALERLVGGFSEDMVVVVGVGVDWMSGFAGLLGVVGGGAEEVEFGAWYLGWTSGPLVSLFVSVFGEVE